MTNDDYQLFKHGLPTERAPNQLMQTRGCPRIDDNTCTICLEPILKTHATYTHIVCRWCFHAGCLEEWLSFQNYRVTCPACRGLLNFSDFFDQLFAAEDLGFAQSVMPDPDENLWQIMKGQGRLDIFAAAGIRRAKVDLVGLINEAISMDAGNATRISDWLGAPVTPTFRTLFESLTTNESHRQLQSRTFGGLTTIASRERSHENLTARGNYERRCRQILLIKRYETAYVLWVLCYFGRNCEHPHHLHARCKIGRLYEMTRQVLAYLYLRVLEENN